LSVPTSQIELQYTRKGHRFIAGVDEVGRGCLAGPVVGAAVILDLNNIPDGINDSKKLSAKKREALVPLIKEACVAYAVGVGSVKEVDSINILNAAKLAMVRAIQKLEPKADFLLVDGNQRLNSEIPQLTVIQGDSKSVSIGAASILAKVYRDLLMAKMDEKYPGYEFTKHKGYGSKVHRLAMQKLGLSPIHRKSFSWTPVQGA